MRRDVLSASGPGIPMERVESHPDGLNQSGGSLLQAVEQWLEKTKEIA